MNKDNTNINMIDTHQANRIKRYVTPDDKKRIASKRKVSYGYVAKIATRLSFNAKIAFDLLNVADKNEAKAKASMIKPKLKSDE